MTECIEVDLGINVGERFTDLKKFQDELQTKSASKFVQFFISGSRTVESAARKVKRYLDPQLKFYYIYWSCVHGGRQYKSRGKGLRKTNTLRKEQLCPAHVQIIVATSGREFIVSSVIKKHNHLVSKPLFQMLPHNRKLPDDVKADTMRLLQMKIDKKMLRTDLENRLGKCITLKDIRNLKYLGKKEMEGKQGKNNLQTVYDKLRSVSDTDCYLLIDGDVFKGLTFFTKEMKGSMVAFPELISIDATYKLADINASLSVILNEDGNGESSVVGVGILIQEDKASLEWFLNTFKSCNSSWDKIQNIMSDKAITERDVLKKVFPNAELQFVVLKIFRNEITCEKFKITTNARLAVLELLQKLIYSKTELEFNTILIKIVRNFPNRIYQYLNEHWVDIKEEWCPFLGGKVHNFMNTTNNRLERINANLKEVCSKHRTLEQFVDHLLTALNSLEKEKNARIANFLNKRKANFDSIEDFRSNYSKLLTPYAFKKLETQFSFSDVKFSFEANFQFYKVKSDNSLEYFTTNESCTCYFHKSMGMPCRHIFAIRDFLKKNLFDSELVINRWKMSYFLENSVFANSSAPEDTPENSSSVCSDNLPINSDNLPKNSDNLPNNRSRPMTCKERYKQIFVKAKLIATLAADLTGNDYLHLNSLLDQIITKLQNRDYNFDNVSKNVCEETDHVLEEIHHNSDEQSTDLNSANIVMNNKNISREHQYSINMQINNDVATVVDDLDNHNQQTETVIIDNGHYEVPEDALCLENIKVPNLKRPGNPAGSATTVSGPLQKKKKKNSYCLLLKCQ